MLYFILREKETGTWAWGSGKSSKYMNTKSMNESLFKGIQLSTPKNPINVLLVVFPKKYNVWLFNEVRKPKGK